MVSAVLPKQLSRPYRPLFQRILLGLYCLLSAGVCTAQDSNSQKLSIVVGHENPAIHDIVKQFKVETGIAIDTRFFDNSELKVELLQRSESVTLPDAAILPADFLGLASLQYSEIPPQLLSEQTSPIFKQSAMIKGQFRSVPIIAGNHLLLFYNKRLVRDAASTWRELQQQAKQLPADVRAITWSYNEMYWLIPFITAMQSIPLSEDTVQLDTSAMQQALAFYTSVAKQGLVDPNCDYHCSISAFNAGQAAYLLSGDWSLGALRDALGEDLGVASLPMIADHPMRSYFSTHVLTFPGNALNGEKRPQLLRLIEYLQSELVQRLLWQKMQVLPVNTKLLRELDQIGNPRLHTLIEQLNQSIPLPTSEEMAIVWEAMGIGFRRYAAEIVTAEQATQLMQHLAEESINRHGQRAN